MYQGESQHWSDAQAELVEIGTIGKFTIYDLYYDRTHGPYPGDGMRSVLVKVGKDMYREINVERIIRKDSFPSSEIVNLEGEPILIAKSHDGGNNPISTKGCICSVRAAL